MAGRTDRHRGPTRERSVLARLGVMGTVVLAVICTGVRTGGAVSAQDCDSVTISSVDVERCVVAGHQPEIDAGNVVRVGALSTSNGHWLAGHRSTHGSTFGPLTGMQIGDVVGYRSRQYRIVEYTTARFASPGHVLGWTRTATPTVVLQTSVDGVSAHLWRAEAVTARTEPRLVEAAIASVLAPLTSVSPTLDATPG